MRGFFRNQGVAIKNSVQRFLGTFCFSVALFGVMWYMVVARSVLGNVTERLALTFAFGILFCTFGKVLFERYGARWKNWAFFADIKLIVLSGLAYFALGNNNDPYVIAGYIGIMLALFVGIFYFADRDCTCGGHTCISQTFSHIFKGVVFNVLVCAIVSLGTLIAILAIHFLINEFAELWKVIAVTNLFIWIVLLTNLSLAAIPQDGAELVSMPKLFKVIVMYVAFPVYMLVFAVLYIYLARILITLTFPSGQVNWFASFASLFFVFFMLTLKQFEEENSLARVFSKLGGYFIIPIIIVQFVSMGIRLNAYGLTSARYVSLIANSIALIFAVVSVVKRGKWIRHMFAVVMVAALLVTVTPLNLHDIPIRAQANRLMQVLEANNMIVDGEVVPNEDVSDEDKAKIRSAFSYIARNDTRERMPEFMRTDDFDGVYGFARWVNDSGMPYPLITSGRFNSSDSFNISGYSYMQPFSGSNLVYLSTEVFDITSYVSELYELHGERATNLQMEIGLENAKIILNQTNFVIEDNAFQRVTYSDGWVLY